MTQSKHTPGPWSYNVDQIRKTKQTKNGLHSEIIASNVRNRHNAHLIAAAPELLGALEDLYDLALRYAPIAEHGKGSRFEQARNAIAKAKKENTQ